jgi:hypothetical protein
LLTISNKKQKTGGRDMKKFFKMFGVVGILAGMLMLSGCGDDGTATTSGRVVKGPVNGAKITYSDATTETSTSEGYYTYKGLAVTTTGGTYTDLNGATKSAPDMATPAGKANVTPLTTIFAKASAADQAALLTLLGGASIDTYVVGTVSGATAILVAKLNETIGEVLAQAKSYGVTVNYASMATAVAKLSPTTITGTGGGTALATAAVSGVSFTDAQKALVIAAAVVIADKAKEGATIPTAVAPTTPTTGTGSSSTGAK